MTDRLQKSKDFTEEYCCSVVRVGQLEPVENSDNLMRTVVNGERIVVNKQDVKEGDVMLYVSNECQISDWFLTANNMFRHWEKNANRAVVEAHISQDPDFLKSDEGKRMVGYFEDTGRVRMIKLRGCPSFGVLFKPETMSRCFPDTAGIDWTDCVGQDFDTIKSDGFLMTLDKEPSGTSLFVKPYVPRRTPGSGRHGHGQKGVSRWDRLNRMVPGQFRLHYDTAPLKKHLMDFSPRTRLTATVKMHGTSFICANVLTKTPLRLFRLRRWVNRLLGRELIREARREYGMVVSSRKVIKNEWNDQCEHSEGFYGHDIWTEYGNIIFPYLPEGYTVYGEICGYLPGGKMIQKDYDYGCRPDENFLMLYRATRRDEEGRLVELSIEEVGRLTESIKARMQEAGDPNAGRMFNILGVRLFEGSVAQLLAGIGNVPDPKADYDISDFPDRLAERCEIERREPLCRNKVPREGVVVRIEGDEVAEAFKLKSMAFLEREKKAIDQGEVDMEMQEAADGGEA